MKSLLILLALTSSMSMASAEPNGCYTAQDVESLLPGNPKNLNQMRRCLTEFELPKTHDAFTLERSANAVAKACAEYLPMEKDVDLHSFCYEIYNQNPQAMQAAWARLDPFELRIVKTSYKKMIGINKILKKELSK